MAAPFREPRAVLLKALRSGGLTSSQAHSGAHIKYNEAVAEALDRIPDNLSDADTMERVYEIQARAVWAFSGGASLSAPNRASQSWWLDKLTGAI